MNNKPDRQDEPRKQDGVAKKQPRLILWLVRSLSNNLGLKLLSLLLAILLWNYVITTNTSITRTKTLYNLTGYISGQSTLNVNRLALTEYPTSDLSDISVTIEAAQADYSRVSADNVQVTLDLSSVRSAGTQEIPLRAATSYGRVRSITPSTLTLTFETLDSRNVAVNSEIAGASDDYWYSVTRTNPAVLTVSGASSVVQSIASARVTADVSDMNSSATRALPYVLLDSAGNEIPQTMLNCSTSSISVSLDIYPCRDIPVSTDYANVVTGVPGEGYVLQSVSVSPDTIQVAAEKELLDSLTELMIEPVSIEGATQSFTGKATVSQLSNFRNVSSEQVYVNVVIAEETISSELENIKVMFLSKAEDLVATYGPLVVTATGPRSAVENVAENGLTVNVNLSGCGAGTYAIEPEIDAARYPDLEFRYGAISVTLTDIDEGEGAANAAPDRMQEDNG